MHRHTCAVHIIQLKTLNAVADTNQWTVGIAEEPAIRSFRIGAFNLHPGRVVQTDNADASTEILRRPSYETEQKQASCREESKDKAANSQAKMEFATGAGKGLEDHAR